MILLQVRYYDPPDILPLLTQNKIHSERRQNIHLLIPIAAEIGIQYIPHETCRLVAQRLPNMLL